MRITLSVLAIGFVFTACSEASEDMGPVSPSEENIVKVNIATEIETRSAVSPAKTAFANGDEMNIWAKTYGSVNADDIKAGIRATNNGGAWLLNPEIYLDQAHVKNAFIYAVAPYSPEYGNAGKIAIDINKQEDVLYSGSYVPVSYTTHNAKLKMKHALSLATFNIFKQGYTGKGNLRRITLYGDSIYVKGEMTAEKGKVYGKEKGDLTIAYDKIITEQGWTEDMPQMWVIPIPFNTKSTEAYLKATIDDVEYTSIIPEVEMKTGFQYVFHLVLTNNGLEFIPDQTSCVSLNDDSDEIASIEGYAVLTMTHNGNKEFSALIMNGNNVFGTIKWGDNFSDSYRDGIEHIYETSDSHQILVESWNSTGFHLKNISGISTIDISQYE